MNSLHKAPLSSSQKHCTYMNLSIIDLLTSQCVCFNTVRDIYTELNLTVRKHNGRQCYRRMQPYSKRCFIARQTHPWAFSTRISFCCYQALVLAFRVRLISRQLNLWRQLRSGARSAALVPLRRGQPLVDLGLTRFDGKKLSTKTHFLVNSKPLRSKRFPAQYI